MIIEADRLHGDCNEDGTLIICAPTGIILTAQVGGLRCEHPKVEGFSIPFFNENEDNFNDCGWGCYNSIAGNKDNSGYLKRYAEAIDKYLVNYPDIKFDYERINELMEGWWPVLKSINDEEFKAYLHLGNCD